MVKIFNSIHRGDIVFYGVRVGFNAWTEYTTFTGENIYKGEEPQTTFSKSRYLNVFLCYGLDKAGRINPLLISLVGASQ